MSTTLPKTVTRSHTESRPARTSFGTMTKKRSIEELAAAGKKYDPDLAYMMSVISAWAYADEKALAGKLRYYGIEGARVRCMSIQNDALLVVSTAYFIQSRSGKVGVLAFRGTDPASFVTMLADAEVMQRPFRDSGVHAGFYANVEAIWDDVTDAIEAARASKHLADGGPVVLSEPLEALYITGHSLGGAMAVLAAARLFRDEYKSWNPRDLVRGVYTFGQPMVGDERFAAECDADFGSVLFRHVYRGDVVPHLPPRSDLPYAHTGPERRSQGVDRAWEPTDNQSRRAHLTEAVLEVAFNALELRLRPNSRIGGYSIDDHMPANYLEVSRYTVNPESVAAAPPRRSWIPPLAEAALEGVEAARASVQQAVTRFLRGRSEPT
jgi:hypothetical protein